jgi:hypothetical protein
MGDGAAVEGWALHQLGTKALCWGEPATAESLLNQALAIRQEVGAQSAIDATQHNLDVLHLPPGGPPPPDTPPPSEPGPPPAGAGRIPALAKGLSVLAVAGAVAVGAWFVSRPPSDGDGFVPGPAVVEPSTVEEPELSVGQLEADPPVVEFEVLEVGRLAFREVELQNGGDLALGLEGAFFDSGVNFTEGEWSCPLQLEVGASCKIEIAFAPAVAGDHADHLFVDHSGTGSPLVIDLSGSAFGTVELAPMPRELEFGEVIVGEADRRAVEITNVGTAPAEIAFIDTDPGFPFTIADDSCGETLAVGDTCLIVVRMEVIDLEAHAALAEEGDPALVEAWGVPAFLGHSGTLIVESTEGARLEIPLVATTVAPYPDLVSRIEFVEPAGFDEVDQPVFRIAVTVINIGRAPTDWTALETVVVIGGDLVDTAPLIPMAEDVAGVAGPLGPDDAVTVEGFVRVPIAGLPTGTPVEIWAFADGCLRDDPDVGEDCRVIELDEVLGRESNNWSGPVEAIVPNRIIGGIIELPEFPFFQGEFTTTSTIG